MYDLNRNSARKFIGEWDLVFFCFKPDLFLNITSIESFRSYIHIYKPTESITPTFSGVGGVERVPALSATKKVAVVLWVLGGRYYYLLWLGSSARDNIQFF